MNEENDKFSELIKKIERMKKSGEVDLSTEEDLSIAVMNLVSLEEHFFFTNAKTGKEGYLELLLGMTMRLIEVGTKLQSDGKKEEAKEIYGKANEIYSLFWALRLKLIDTTELKKIASEEKPWTLTDIMNKLVDCCDE